MDTRPAYPDIVENVLLPFSGRRYVGEDIENEAIFDRKRDRYLIVGVGWRPHERIRHILLHLDIINGKVWIQTDGTEYGIADELEAAGIPPSDIVLAFHPEKDRALIPGYAVA